MGHAFLPFLDAGRVVKTMMWWGAELDPPLVTARYNHLINKQVAIIHDLYAERQSVQVGVATYMQRTDYNIMQN